jgi:hypothetical protein
VRVAQPRLRLLLRRVRVAWRAATAGPIDGHVEEGGGRLDVAAQRRARLRARPLRAHGGHLPLHLAVERGEAVRDAARALADGAREGVELAHARGEQVGQRPRAEHEGQQLERRLGHAARAR